jgi:Peroxiredoxin
MNTLIGKEAPYFVAKAALETQIIDEFSLKELRGKYVVFSFTLLILHLSVQLNFMLSRRS